MYAVARMFLFSAYFVSQFARLSMVSRIYGRVRLTGRPALQHGSRETPYVGCHIRGPMSPIVKIFFEYLFLGQGHDSLKFPDRNLEKNLGKNFPPGGSDPPNFFQSDIRTNRAIRLQILISISQKLWPVGASNCRAHRKQKNKQKLDGG